MNATAPESSSAATFTDKKSKSASRKERKRKLKAAKLGKANTENKPKQEQGVLKDKSKQKSVSQSDSQPVGESTSSVGLLRCSSPWLRRDNVCLGVFTHNSVLTFSGCVQLRVLGGLILCNGYGLKPSPSYQTLYSPHNHPHLSFMPMDPQLQDEDFNSYLAPFRDRENLHFHSVSAQSTDTPKREEGAKCKGRGCLHMDIGTEDVEQLNLLVKRKWNHITALVLLRSVGGDTIPLLNYWTRPASILHVSPQIIDGFRTVAGSQELKIPPSYLQVAWELAGKKGVRVLVCGEGNTGKSTLCRFLINYMLNRYPCVGYLDCDPGQPELTVPEVLSLHIVTEPIFGPPYTHLRKPYKGYYYGDKTPQADPEYYLSVLQALHCHYVEEVCSSDPTTPLVINTCGWLQSEDMGVQLFLDIVRTFKPTHIVRTAFNKRLSCDSLPPLTSEFLTNTPGLFRTTDVTPFTEASSNQSAVTPGDDNNDDVIMHGSSDELLSDDSSGDLLASSPSSNEDGSDSDQSQSSNSDDQLSSDNEQIVKRRHKRKKLKVAGASFVVHHGNSRTGLSRGISLKDLIGRGWIDVPPHRVYYLQYPGTSTSGSKKSRKMRRLGYISYFSGLFSLAEEVARQHSLPDPHGNMLQYAPPLEIPWKDVAIHICLRNVPNCQALYALNGKIVALGRVDPKEFSERDPSHPDTPRFLKSDTPLIEFIGLGVVRGIDVDSRLFYLTSPECTSTHSLSRVNVIALGNPDQLDFFSTQQAECSVVGESPYLVQGYQSLLGMYSWTPS